MQVWSFSFLLFFLVSFNSFASDLAEEYLVSSNWKITIDQQVENAISNHLKSNPNSNKEQVARFYQSTMGWDAIKVAVKKTINAKFSQKELAEIVDFYKTKAGSKLASESPAISAAVMEVIVKNQSAYVQ
jgi:hypothetical protein